MYNTVHCECQSLSDKKENTEEQQQQKKNTTHNSERHERNKSNENIANVRQRREQRTPILPAYVNILFNRSKCSREHVAVTMNAE